jgi:hypothetical protein
MPTSGNTHLRPPPPAEKPKMEPLPAHVVHALYRPNRRRGGVKGGEGALEGARRSYVEPCCTLWSMSTRKMSRTTRSCGRSNGGPTSTKSRIGGKSMKTMILSGSDAPWSCMLALRLSVAEYVLYPVFHFVVATGVFLYSCHAVCFLPTLAPSRFESSRSLVSDMCLVFGSDVSS